MLQFVHSAAAWANSKGSKGCQTETAGRLRSCVSSRAKNAWHTVCVPTGKAGASLVALLLVDLLVSYDACTQKAKVQNSWKTDYVHQIEASR